MTTADHPSAAVPEQPQSAPSGTAETQSQARRAGQPAGAPVKIDREVFAVYVGPNAGPFLATLDKMRVIDPASNHQVRSWSWPAFLVPLPWLLYRKQWPPAAAITFTPLVLFYLFPSASSGGTIGLAFVVGTYAKSWYVMSGAARIRRILSEEPDPMRAREKIARAGGVSIPGAVIGGIIFAAACVAALAPLFR